MGRLRAYVVVAALTLVAPAGASAAAPAIPAAAAAPTGASGPDLATRASALADEVVARWTEQQRPDGRFPDPITGAGGDYGTAMLGYAMLRRGAADGDRELMQGGLNALLAQVEIPAGGAFELLTLARAYRWANGTLPSDPVGGPLWAKAGPRIARDLSLRGPVGSSQPGAKCYADARCYNNLKLVSSLASLELQETGLTAGSGTSLLADVGIRGRLLHRVGNRVPKETGADVIRSGAAPLSGGGLLSDPPRNPLAYHALSTMMLGELINELGPDAPKTAVQAFDRASRALLVLASPDGDITYFGRGQGQVWVPAVLADASALAAQRTTSPVLRGRFLALAEASLTRLRNVYGVGAAGFPLVPGAVSGPVLAARSVDPYATTRGYNGLAVDSLDRAAATLRAVQGNATRVPSSRAGVVRSPRQAGVATITRGGLWAAVAAKSRAPEDARYGSGLLALQRRDAAGRWSPIAPGRPYNPRLVNTLAIKQNGTTLVADGTLTRAVPAGVAITGGWSKPGTGATPLDHGTVFTWSLLDDRTLQVRFTAKNARQVIANGLVGDGSVVRNVPFGFTVTSPDGSVLQYSLGVAERRLPLQRAVRPAGGSAYDAHLQVAQAWATVRRGEHVILKVRVIQDAPTPASGG